jgi:hypothetical protein
MPEDSTAREPNFILLIACTTTTVKLAVLHFGSGLSWQSHRGDHEHRYGCHMYALTAIDASTGGSRPDWEAEVSWPQPLSAQKGCRRLARFVRVPRHASDHDRRQAAVSHRLQTHIPAATRRLQWRGSSCGQIGLHRCTALVLYDALAALLPTRPPKRCC